MGPTAPEELWGVDASAPDNVWAVGMRTTEGNITPHSLIERWDGPAWSIVPCPDIGLLWDVAVVSPHDVWATGDQSLLHWDGQAWCR
jgi:hypothetical protein